MATLLSASQAPSSKQSEGSQPAILSPQGRKRYFVVHGGLFSKDGVTLDDVKKIDRYGKQPGQEGLMCEVSLHVGDGWSATNRMRCSYCGRTRKSSQVEVLLSAVSASALDRT